MDVGSFASELVRAIADAEPFESVSLDTEGPVASGRVYAGERTFLQFYFNEVSGTMAFVLVEGEQRIGGIDYDNRRGWHLHPVDCPTDHIPVEALSVREIVTRLADMVRRKATSK